MSTLGGCPLADDDCSGVVVDGDDDENKTIIESVELYILETKRLL